MRLLPRNPRDLGWTPYVWLAYLVFFLLAPIPSPAAAASYWLWRLVTIAVFLPLYFAGYRFRDKRLLWVVGGIVLLGALQAPFNSAAATFFIYAAAFAGRLSSVTLAVRCLGIIIATVIIESWLLSLDAGFWAITIIFSVITSASNIHFAQQRQANAKLYLAQQEIERLAQTAERERIARDLHDLLGHTLSLVILKSELASKLIDQNPERAAREIREVEQVGREALAQVREAVRGYQALGLPDELRRVHEMLATAGIESEISSTDLALSPAQTTAMVLALREAVTNVVRHADARRCRIRITGDWHACELEVADDGIGGQAPEGAGLGGMRERIEKLGGSVERDTSRGTTLHIRLPLTASATSSEVA